MTDLWFWATPPRSLIADDLFLSVPAGGVIFRGCAHAADPFFGKIQDFRVPNPGKSPIPKKFIQKLRFWWALGGSWRGYWGLFFGSWGPLGASFSALGASWLQDGLKILLGLSWSPFPSPKRFLEPLGRLRDVPGAPQERFSDLPGPPEDPLESDFERLQPALKKRLTHIPRYSNF